MTSASSRRTPASRQPPQDRPAGRAGVDEHGDAVLLQQRRVALADVEERHDELAAGGRLDGPDVDRGDEPERDHGRRHEGGDDATVSVRGIGPEPRGRLKTPPRRPQPDERGGEHRVRAGQRGRRAEPHGQHRRRRGRERMRDPLDERKQRRVHGVERHRESGRDLRRCRAQHPQPHHGRDRHRRQEVRRQGGQRDLLEVERHQRRRADGGGDRDGSDVGDRIRHPAREHAPQRRGEREQRDHGGERQLPAGLPDRARVQRERHGRGEPERVPAVRGTARERGDEAGGAHHPGTLDRRTGAGERDIEGHQRKCDEEPRAQRHSEHGAGRQNQHGEQHHVLAADRQHVGETGALEVVAHVLGEALVLAEHHPAQQRRLRLGQPARQSRLGATSRGVDEPGEAAAPLSGRPQGRDLDGRARAAPSLIGIEPPERRDGARDGHDVADARPRLAATRPPALCRHRPRHATTLAHTQHGHLPIRRAAEQPRPSHGRADGALAHGLEQHGPRTDRAPKHVGQRTAVERREPHVRDTRAREHRRGDDERQRRRGRGRESGEREPCGDDGQRRGGGRRDHRRGRQRAEQEAGGEREQDDVPRVAVDRREGRPHLTPAPARGGTPAARRRSRAPRQAPRRTRSRRWSRGSRGCSARWRVLCRRARRAARAWPCSG